MIEVELFKRLSIAVTVNTVQVKSTEVLNSK